jgi:type IV secretory pathway protease TraF
MVGDLGGPIFKLSNRLMRWRHWSGYSATVFCGLFLIGSAGCGNNQGQVSGVTGFSMAPGVVVGDQICWQPCRSDVPERLARVICVSPDHAPALKRLIGFGGEQIDCQAGELSVDGELVQKTPDQLAELATVVASGAAGWAAQSSQWQSTGDRWSWAGGTANHVAWLNFERTAADRGAAAGPGVFYDDSPWLDGERRRLELVADVGLAAVLDLAADDRSTTEVVLEVGGLAARLVLHGGGRMACVAGLLDRRFVVAAWSLADGVDAAPLITKNFLGSDRQLFPAGLPTQWQQTVPIAEATQPAPMRIGIQAIKGAAKGIISHLVVWRDVCWLPHGPQTCWDVPPGKIFVLGDCPAASRDSRQWGPLPARAILGEVIPPASKR